MEQLNNDISPVKSEIVSKNRRLLLKAGWTIPVIAATPLLNTAAALSQANCAGLYAQLDEAKRAGDKPTYQNLKGIAKDAGCDISAY